MTELSQLALIWGGTLLAVFLARATRLTPVVYYLGVGALFVNFGLLPHESSEFIRGLSEVGIILIMFALGFEENAVNFIRSIKKSWGIAFFGALAPFLAAFGVAYFFWNDINIAVMCGLAMTATAVSLTMVSLKSEGLANSPVATRIMTSAVLDDIASLALVAIVVPMITSGDEVGVASIGWIVAKAVVFFVIISIIGACLFPHNPKGWIARIPILDKFGLRQLLTWGGGEHAILLSLLLALLSALIGHTLGFHPAVGAYMAGLIIAEEYYFDGKDEGSFADTKRIVDNVAFSWIGPVFFVNLGAKIEFDWDLLVSVIPQIAMMTSLVMMLQVTSASLAARYTGGMNGPASVMVGLGMLGRAELAFVVLDIAYVQYQILNKEAFYTLMVTCFWLNISVPLTIHWWRPRYVASKGREDANEVQSK